MLTAHELSRLTCFLAVVTGSLDLMHVSEIVLMPSVARLLKVPLLFMNIRMLSGIGLTASFSISRKTSHCRIVSSSTAEKTMMKTSVRGSIDKASDDEPCTASVVLRSAGIRGA